MNHSESLTKLATALAKAQGEMENAAKTSDNPFFRSKYADLAEVINTVRPVLAKHGLSVVQMPGFDGTAVYVENVILHESGEWMSATSGSPMPIMTTKDGRELPPSPQGVGSAITYLRRYSLAAVCMVAQEDDDDAEAASAPAREHRPAAPRPAPSSEPVGVKHHSGDVPTCAKCGGAMWDNRPKKASGEFKPNSPDFACKDKTCKHAMWLEKEKPGTSAEELEDVLNRAAEVGAITADQITRIEKTLAEGDADHMGAALSWLQSQMNRHKLSA